MSDEKETWHHFLKKTGNKITSQRDLILNVLMQAEGHPTAEELYELVKAEDPSIGFTTIYRTMKLLVEAGLAREEKFEDGQKRFEYDYNRQHHDHLICEGCGLVIEFFNPFIESEQERIVEQFGFLSTHHSLRIFGLCAQCRPQLQLIGQSTVIKDPSFQ